MFRVAAALAALNALIALIALIALVVWPAGSAQAQGTAAAPAAAERKEPRRVAPRPASRPAASAPRAAAAASTSAPQLSGRSGKGWKEGPIPTWVIAPPAPAEGVARAAEAGGRRDQLVDLQANHTLRTAQQFVRIRSVALNAGALGTVSQPQIHFNPAYQTVVVHAASVWRDGQRGERLAEARIEPMRREQRLEQQILDGNETLLVIVNDVRVGEPVEISYTVEGENPIFEGRISSGMTLAGDAPIDILHHRLVAPATRPLRWKALGTELAPIVAAEGGQQVLSLVRQQVPALPSEQGVPPWVRAAPLIDISEYRDWAEVDAWAARLFALPEPAAPAVAARAAAFRAGGLTGSALVSEVLRFVQDEVRYLSISIGASSHRPKAPERTLADLNGDCKDKVVLLNALLRELGFEAKPALVSLRRNRGIGNNLPSHDLFDHVISRLELDGRVFFLDATSQGQGLTLAGRGQWPYGMALVVGAGTELQSVPTQDSALDRVEYEQRWDLSKPGAPTRLSATLRAHGLAAERWRAVAAGLGTARLAEALGGDIVRTTPGLQGEGEPKLQDDRQANIFEFQLSYTHPALGQYSRGALEIELAAHEMLGTLVGPSEARRRLPWLLDTPRLVEGRIVVLTPRPMTAQPPAPVEVSDRHFRFALRVEQQSDRFTLLRRYERRADEVQPENLGAWREKLLQARQLTTSRARLALVDTTTAVSAMRFVEQRLRSERGWRQDALFGIQMRNEFSRLIDGTVASTAVTGSLLAAQALASRAQANNLLGQFADALGDADKALATHPKLAAALEARGVALIGLGKADEALASFGAIDAQPRAAAISSWMASVHYHLGQHGQAERLLREAVDQAGGDEREFALIWLFLAAEAQGRRGKEAVAAHVDGVDPAKFTGALLRFLVGAIDNSALLAKARERADMERLNLAEAHFYVGQLQMLRGQRDEALRSFERVVQTQATPYREMTFARLELRRAGR